MTESHRSARRALPRVPEEVFELWLDQAIDEHGWAPESSEWASILRRRRMSYWRELEWREETIRLRSCRLSAESRYAAAGIARAAFRDAKNEYADLAQRAKTALRSHVREINDTGTVEGKLICLRTPDGVLDVVDGTIRLTALLHAYRNGDSRAFAKAWVGIAPAPTPRRRATDRRVG